MTEWRTSYVINSIIEASCHLDPPPRFLPPPFVKDPTILATTRKSWQMGIPSPICLTYCPLRDWQWRVFFQYCVSRICSVVPLEFPESVPPLEQQLIPSHSSRSRCRYNIYLGLHPYVKHGARSGLEIAVDSHEGAVPFSTLPAIYRGQHYSLLSV